MSCVDTWWAPSRANPAASKAMARIDRLIRHGWKPTMAQYVTLSAAEKNGFKLSVMCMDSPKEMGRSTHRPFDDGRMEYMITVSERGPTRTDGKISFERTLDQLDFHSPRRSGKVVSKVWILRAVVQPSILDEPEEQRLTGITVTRPNPPATLGSKLRALDHYATPFIDLAAVGLAVVGVVATDRWIRRKAGVRR